MDIKTFIRLKYTNYINRSHKYISISSKIRQLQFLVYIKTNMIICLEETYPKNSRLVGSEESVLSIKVISQSFTKP